MHARTYAEQGADFIQPALIQIYDGPMDGDQVEEFSMMLQEEINKLMGNV